jgi:hypothetical protein
MLDTRGRVSSHTQNEINERIIGDGPVGALFRRTDG